MSLCDRCFDPGSCCRFMWLNEGRFPEGETMLDALVYLASTWPPVDAEGSAFDAPIPMMPLFKDSDGRWVLWCPNLRRDGGCGDYERRPQLCRDFEPASSRLCVHHGCAEGAEG